MDITFSKDEMLAYLRSWGFKIKTEKKKFYRSVYHDDVEEYTATVDVVYDSTGKLETVENYQYERDQAVSVVFNRAFKQRLFHVLT